MRRGFGPMQKNVGGQEWNDPAISILGIDGPFEAQPCNQLNPDDGKDGHWKPAYAMRSRSDCQGRRRADAVHGERRICRFSSLGADQHLIRGRLRATTSLMQVKSNDSSTFATTKLCHITPFSAPQIDS